MMTIWQWVWQYPASTTCLSHPVLTCPRITTKTGSWGRWLSLAVQVECPLQQHWPRYWLRLEEAGTRQCQCSVRVASECHGKADTDIANAPVSSAVQTLPVFGTDCSEQLPVVFCAPQCLLGGADIGVSVMWSEAWPGDMQPHHVWTQFYLSHLNHHSSWDSRLKNN